MHPLRAPSISWKVSTMSIEPDSMAFGATIIDLAAQRAKRAGRGAVSAPSVTPNVMWVPVMMMVLMPMPVSGADRTHAG
jgi:hypothetical protein